MIAYEIAKNIGDRGKYNSKRNIQVYNVAHNSAVKNDMV